MDGKNYKDTLYIKDANKILERLFFKYLQIEKPIEILWNRKTYQNQKKHSWLVNTYRPKVPHQTKGLIKLLFTIGYKNAFKPKNLSKLFHLEKPIKILSDQKTYQNRRINIHGGSAYPPWRTPPEIRPY